MHDKWTSGEARHRSFDHRGQPSCVSEWVNPSPQRKLTKVSTVVELSFLCLSDSCCRATAVVWSSECVRSTRDDVQWSYGDCCVPLTSSVAVITATGLLCFVPTSRPWICQSTVICIIYNIKIYTVVSCHNADISAAATATDLQRTASNPPVGPIN